jgi:hypothetical protein
LYIIDPKLNEITNLENEMILKRFNSRRDFLSWIGKSSPVMDVNDLKTIVKNQKENYPYVELHDLDYRDFRKIIDTNT